MLTTKDKLELLKKCQTDWLRDGNLDSLLLEQLKEAGLKMSYLTLLDAPVDSITEADILDY